MTHDADAASILFNLPGYRVLSAGDDPADETAGRWVLVEAVAVEGGCPDCGVISGRIHARPVQVVKDVPCGGTPVQVGACGRRGDPEFYVDQAVVRPVELELLYRGVPGY